MDVLGTWSKAVRVYSTTTLQKEGFAHSNSKNPSFISTCSSTDLLCFHKIDFFILFSFHLCQSGYMRFIKNAFTYRHPFLSD